MSDPSALSTVVNVFASPSEAFAVIKERQRAWLPLLILFAGIWIVSMLYLHKVDLRWLIDSQIAQGLSQSNAQLTEEQRQKAIESALRFSPTVYGALGASVSSLVVLIFISISALYYSGVSFFTGDGVSFKQWFALVCWCTLPAVLGIGAQIVNLIVSDARFMPQDALNPLAFGNLLSIDRTGATIIQRVLLGIDVTTLWSLVLAVLGYQAWTKSSLVKTLGVVFGPWIVIVAIGTAVAFL
jgi:Yip1 domain